jgi:hypothetical protein
MTNTEIVAGIYTCLEMLRMENENLHAWWCGMLYEANGDIAKNSWSEHHLTIMENDCIYNIPLAR